MNTILLFLCVTFVLLAFTATAWALAYMLTEYKGPIIDIKPFNCRPCMTFWLSILSHLAATPIILSSAKVGTVLVPCLHHIEVRGLILCFVVSGMLAGIAGFRLFKLKGKIDE